MTEFNSPQDVVDKLKELITEYNETATEKLKLSDEVVALLGKFIYDRWKMGFITTDELMVNFYKKQMWAMTDPPELM